MVEGLNMVHSDPQFVHQTGDDYHVKSGSPCHNTAHDGTDMGAYGGTDPLTWVP